MKAFKYVFFLILIAIIGISIYIAVQPNTFEISRTRTIKAPASVIYKQVIDFKNWKDWSYWFEADKDIKITYRDVTRGVNGSYAWHDKDGIGKMKTIAAVENVAIQQEMIYADFPPTDIHWDFKSNENGSSDVTGKISGKNLSFGFKAHAIFTGGIENKIESYLERSLQKLDSLIIDDMKKYSIIVNGVTNHSGGYYLYNTTSCSMSEIASKMQEMLPQVEAYAKKNHIATAGASFIYYHKWDEENNAVIFSSCVPTTDRVITTEGDEILTGELPTFKALKTTLKGNYSNLKEAWDTAWKHIAENGYEFVENGPMLETYLTEPKNTPNPADWTTEIYIAIKEKELVEE